MKNKYLNILVCPNCHAKLEYKALSTAKTHHNPELGDYNEVFICKFEQLAYPIINNIPVIIINHAIIWKKDE